MQNNIKNGRQIFLTAIFDITHLVTNVLVSIK
jgi:hypothetical protein